jgi:hypothetical protein
MGVSRHLDFREKFCTKLIRAIALMMEAASISEMSVSFYQTTSRTVTTQKTAIFKLAAVRT